MNTTLSLSLAALALVAPLPPTAEGIVGDRLPPTEFEGFHNTEAKDLSDYRGRLVLIEFFETDYPGCKERIRGLNKLQKKFGDKGLSVLGIASENPELTVEWMDKGRAEYAYAFDPLDKLYYAIGAPPIPACLLVDPHGTILFGGYPEDLKDEVIEKAAADALTEPLFQWPEELAKSAAALRKGKLGKAITEAEAAGDLYAEYVAELEALLDGQVSLLEAAFEEGDYLKVITIAKELEDAVEGRPQAERVEPLVKEIRKDRDKRMVLEAQEDIQKLLAKKIKRKDVQKHVDDLEELRERFPGTIVDRDVDRAIARLRDI